MSKNETNCGVCGKQIWKHSNVKLRKLQDHGWRIVRILDWTGPKWENYELYAYEKDGKIIERDGECVDEITRGLFEDAGVQYT